MVGTENNERAYGKVSTYNGTYCFITPDVGYKDVFAPGHELPRDTDVCRGDRVSFVMIPDPRKEGRKMASDVRLVFDGQCG